MIHIFIWKYMFTWEVTSSYNKHTCLIMQHFIGGYLPSRMDYKACLLIFKVIVSCCDYWHPMVNHKLFND